MANTQIMEIISGRRRPNKEEALKRLVFGNFLKAYMLVGVGVKI